MTLDGANAAAWRISRDELGEVVINIETARAGYHAQFSRVAGVSLAGDRLLRSRYRCVSNGDDGCNVIDLSDRPRLMSFASRIVQQHHGTRTKMAHLPV